MADKKPREATSIKVDPDLWKEVKIQAIREDVEMSEFMERALRRELERVKPR
jgi:predicted transcriptional regulator